MNKISVSIIVGIIYVSKFGAIQDVECTTLEYNTFVMKYKYNNHLYKYIVKLVKSTT
jgi:hypothetical protein